MGKARKADVRTGGLIPQSWLRGGPAGSDQEEEDAAKHHFLLQGIIFSPPSASGKHCLVSLMTKYQPSKGLKPSTSAGITEPNKAALCVAVLHLHTAGIVW